MENNSKSKSSQELLQYIAITFGWTWIFWIAAALTGKQADSFSVILLMALGGLGPAGSAILITLRDRDISQRRDFWQRLVDFRRIRPVWYLIIFLTAPLTSLLAVWTRTLLTAEPYSFEQALTLLSRPLSLLPLIFIVLFFGPLPEEPGWRGYALDRLQTRWNAVTSSLILAIVWAAWHTPLFFIQGTYQQAIGFGTTGFWLFMAGLIPETILITWIFNNTLRSTLSAILFHFMINFTGHFLDPAQGFAVYRLAWAGMIALIIILIFGRNLSKNGAPRDS
jgi:membrane protease YdiL (CAAX protease family)